MADAQLEEYLNSAIDIARKAGEVINDALHKEKCVQTKCAMTDLVTETDERVEKLVIGTLKEKYPTHSFIGEESVSAGEPCNLTDNPTWIIDPVDGTTNFVHRFPAFCISIGLAINKQPAVGVVYNIMLDELYTAIKGKGSFVNGKKLTASSETEIHQSLIITELGYDRSKDKMDLTVKNLRRLMEGPDAAHGLRCLGSAAYNLCTVARGSAEAYYEFGIHCWDIAAGMLILTEAGGVVTSCTGGPIDIMARFVLGAGTEKLAKTICGKIESMELPHD